MPEGQVTQEDLENMSPEEIAEMQKKNCVFCKIIAGDVPSHKVYEDDKIISILDIYPSTKGHTLVLPKQHAPIMPTIPPDIFKHIFRNIKYLARGVREGTPSANTTIFIANGAAAGQQSPHFLLHIIPRDKNDSLSNFDIERKGVSQDDILEPMRANLGKMMQNHLQREGKAVEEAPSKAELAKILEQNPDLRQMLMKEPDKLKAAMDSNTQLKVLFQNVDINALSKRLSDNLEEDDNVDEKPSKDDKPGKEPEKDKDDEDKKDEDDDKYDDYDNYDDDEEPNILDTVTDLFT